MSASFFRDTSKRFRRGWIAGGLLGTTISCAFYGGIGFMLFGMAGLHGGIAIAITLAVIGLGVFEIWFHKQGGITKAMSTWM
jgi:hypothetical protein